MAYRIVYETGTARVQENRRNSARIWVLTAVFLVLFGVLTVKFWPEGREALVEILLPGDPEVTWHALETMVMQLREGEAVGDAVMAFCREIVDGAQIAN